MSEVVVNVLCRHAPVSGRPLCENSAVARHGVAGWDAPRWRDEAERVRAEFFAAAKASGRLIRRNVEPEMLRKRAQQLDRTRLGGAANDDEKRELLGVAIRQIVDDFDRDDLRIAHSVIGGQIDDALETADPSKEVRARAGKLLEPKIRRKLAELDGPGAFDLEAVGRELLALVPSTVASARFSVEVAAEVAGLLDAGTIDPETAKVLRKWSARVTPRSDVADFVRECLASEAQAAGAGRPRRPDLRDFLFEAWPVLEEAEVRAIKMTRSKEARTRADGEAMLDALPGLADSLATRMIWLERLGEPAPDDVASYVGKSLQNRMRDARSAGAAIPGQGTMTRWEPGEGDVTFDPPEESPPPELELDELDAILEVLRRDLFGAGAWLAAVLEVRRHTLGPRQGRMFREVFDVTTVTVRLLRADADSTGTTVADDLAATGAPDHPLVALLRGLAQLGAGGSPGWLKPWTFRALALVDESWAAKHGAIPYDGNRTLPGAGRDWMRLHRITAGADPAAYKDETARGGVITLLQGALAPSIERLHEMGARHRRGEKDEAR